MVVLLGVTGCGGDAQDTAGPAAIDGSDETKGRRAADSGGSGSDPSGTDLLHPTVVIDTSLGSMTVRLDAEKAPLTVQNFRSYVDSGHYDQTIVHQVIKDYPKVVLGGAFTPEGSEKTARTPIYNEAHNGLKNRRGTIAMARQADAIHSATCYFFLNLTDNEVLDHQDRTLEGYGYCVFGEITEGIEVADKIGEVDVEDTEQFERIPVETVMIRSMRWLR
jgi:cyclophilin family peptidyl-prolyl cis-trans isomerase